MGEQSEKSRKIYLSSLGFNELNIKDKDLYYEYVKKTEYPANLWSANFAFLWSVSQSGTRKILWKIVDDMLVTFSYLRSGELYLTCLPFGMGSPEKVFKVLLKCMRYCYKWNKNDASSTVVKVVNSMQLEFLRKCREFDRYFLCIPLRGLEKHFSIEKLISLSGKDFETVRRKINKFHRLYPNAILRKYKPEDYENVLSLGEYWSDTSGKKYSHIFDNLYFPEIIKHCDELEHLILVVEIEGKMVGMVSGGGLPNGESWWCLSKFMNDYDGLSEFIIVELAKEIHKINPNIQLMNAAEDLGSEGLRFFKERFRPVFDLKRYLIKPREKELFH